jgi:hypothetical protein
VVPSVAVADNVAVAVADNVDDEHSGALPSVHW